MSGELFKALAQLQAELPKVGKGNTADTGTYKYKYADLSDVSEAIMPRLGKHGLAFMAKPTMVDGSFVLAYSLVHSSGEREDGVYPLPDKGTPQQLGSAITYARRYCLSAVTGVAAGEDDDGAAAGSTPWQGRSRDPWEDAAPARSPQRRPGPRREDNQPPAQEPAAEAPAAGDIDIDAQAYADEAHDADALKDIEGIHQRAREAGKLNALVRNPSASSDGKPGKLALYLEWKRGQIRKAATPGPSTGITANPDNDDAEWVAAFIIRLAETNDETGIATRRAEIVRATAQQTISAGTANELIADTNKRKAAMTGEPVAA